MTVQKTLASLGISNKKTVFVSGIGCSGRFPYYINSYGFHTLHGRSPAVVSGLCLSRQDLNVWLVIGDGDGFSIGLGHVLHMVRRNINVNVLFINNRIYALTKGQYSPTSSEGVLTKSSPYGSIDSPINPLLMVLSAGCTFVARVLDNDFSEMKTILVKAIEHNGTSFIEILQNCNVYNNKSFYKINESEERLDYVIYLRDNKPLIFGKNNDKCLIIKSDLTFDVCAIDRLNNVELILNKVNSINNLQLMLAGLCYDDIPFPLGLFRVIEKQSYEKKFLMSVINNNKNYNLATFLSKL
jgi:2-oxoglutarate ferredoxin oxidoreductase subunit beta